MKAGIEILEDGFTLLCINLLTFLCHFGVGYFSVIELYGFTLKSSLCMEEEFYVDFLVNCDFCLGI